MTPEEAMVLIQRWARAEFGEFHVCSGPCTSEQELHEQLTDIATLLGVSL